MSTIGDFKNITWSGISYDFVTLNGTDNPMGTTRMHDLDLAGAHVIETITKYSKPPKGPYEEVHTLNLLKIASVNLSAYADYDGTTVTSICDGAASTINFTINFYATMRPLPRVYFIHCISRMHRLSECSWTVKHSRLVE